MVILAMWENLFLQLDMPTTMLTDPNVLKIGIPLLLAYLRGKTDFQYVHHHMLRFEEGKSTRSHLQVSNFPVFQVL